MLCFTSLLHHVQVSEGEPYVMWLSGLHIPESYLTALVQDTCRKNKWPLDKSTLYTSVTEVRVKVGRDIYLNSFYALIVSDCTEIT